MTRRTFDFTLRGDTPEIEALSKYLSVLKKADTRRYQSFIKSALQNYYAHVSYCEQSIKEGGTPFLFSGFTSYGNKELITPSNNQIEELDVVQVQHSEDSEIDEPDTSSSTAEESPSVDADDLDEESDMLATMDASLASILALDEDIP